MQVTDDDRKALHEWGDVLLAKNLRARGFTEEALAVLFGELRKVCRNCLDGDKDGWCCYDSRPDYED